MGDPNPLLPHGCNKPLPNSAGLSSTLSLTLQQRWVWFPSLLLGHKGQWEEKTSSRRSHMGQWLCHCDAWSSNQSPQDPSEQMKTSQHSRFSLPFHHPSAHSAIRDPWMQSYKWCSASWWEISSVSLCSPFNLYKGWIIDHFFFFHSSVLLRQSLPALQPPSTALWMLFAFHDSPKHFVFLQRDGAQTELCS